MRGLEKLIVAAFLGLVVLGVWNIRGWLSQHALVSGREASAEAQPAATAGSGKPGAASHGKSKASARSRMKEPIVTPDGVTIVDVPYLGQPFPEPKDLPNGITAAEIRAGFGDPAAHVTLASNGSLIERYYYVNRDHTRYTIANLQDGRLISAASMPI